MEHLFLTVRYACLKTVCNDIVLGPNSRVSKCEIEAFLSERKYFGYLCGYFISTGNIYIVLLTFRFRICVFEPQCIEADGVKLNLSCGFIHEFTVLNPALGPITQIECCQLCWWKTMIPTYRWLEWL